MNIFQNIEYIGMLSMGAFVGGVLNYGLAHLNDNKAFQKVSTTIFGAAFSGGVFIFLQFLLREKSDNTYSFRSVFMYPVGLLLSLMWAQITETIEVRVSSSQQSKKVLDWAHIIAVGLIFIAIIT